MNKSIEFSLPQTANVRKNIQLIINSIIKVLEKNKDFRLDAFDIDFTENSAVLNFVCSNESAFDTHLAQLKHFIEGSFKGQIKII